MTNPLWTLDATELSQRIASREVSSREVVDAHLERIQEVNGSLRAMTEVFEDEAASRFELRVQVCPVPLSELRHRINTGCLKQVGELGSNSLDTGEIGSIDPLEDERFRNTGLAREIFAALGTCAFFEQFLNCPDPGSTQLLSECGSNPFNVCNVCHLITPTEEYEDFGTPFTGNFG